MLRFASPGVVNPRPWPRGVPVPRFQEWWDAPKGETTQNVAAVVSSKSERKKTVSGRTLYSLWSERFVAGYNTIPPETLRKT